MPPSTAEDAAQPGVARRLEAVATLARVSQGGPLPGVFAAVADAIEAVVGFGIAVVNLYRPQWDDFEVVLVHGHQEARSALLHSVNTRETFEQLLVRACEIGPGMFFIPEEDADAWAVVPTSYLQPGGYPARATPPQQALPWRAGDGLLVTLRNTDGRVIGILSLDAPASGCRPGTEELDVLAAVTAHAALALEHAQWAASGRRSRQILADLLAASGRLATAPTSEDLLDEVSRTAVPGLGFERLTVYLGTGDTLDVWSGSGQPPLDRAALAGLLAEPLDAGCLLVDRAAVLPGDAPSRRNGRGPLAWSDHRLLVPVRIRSGDLVGVLVFDDPVDRLRPDVERRQVLRLLADYLAAACEALDRQSALSYLASHDPLTGVRNRRDLHAGIATLLARRETVSVLMCDLDLFKRVNDRYGHEAGDRVLERFGRVLREHARSEDTPFRFGGEEFCLVLPGVDAADALAVAERLRQATGPALADLAPGQTVSIGVGTAGAGAVVEDLLAAADRALYAAKRAGRDRCRAEPVQVRPATAPVTTTGT